VGDGMNWPIALHKFAAGWLPALAVTASVDPAPRLAELFAFRLGGATFPPVTMVLGLLGVCAARPLVRSKEAELVLWKFLLVSAILVTMVELWVIDSRPPNALFVFVMAIGVGFSGYSLIELAGDQARDLMQRLLSRNPDTGAKE
jgi:hypothetical protein